MERVMGRAGSWEKVDNWERKGLQKSMKAFLF